MKDLTEKQEKVYKSIVEHLKKNQRFPTVRKLCEIHGFKSTNGARSYLKALEKKCCLTKIPNGYKLSGTSLNVEYDFLIGSDDLKCCGNCRFRIRYQSSYNSSERCRKSGKSKASSELCSNWSFDGLKCCDRKTDT